MKDVTVIIPAYNSEKTIGKALESVLMQKDVSTEILCVDDGSTDGTIAVLEEYSEKYDSVRILRQEHKGPGAARNKGIENAIGLYIAFLDADDHLMDDMALSKMIARCEKLDVPVCGAVMNLEDNGVVRRSNTYHTICELSKKGVLQYKDFQYDYDFTSYIYRRDLFDDSEIRFSESFFYEDPPFLVRALHKAKSFTALDVDYYCYHLVNRVRALSDVQCEALINGLKSNIIFALKNDLDVLLMNSLDRLVYEYGDWIYKYADQLKTRAGVESIRSLIGDRDVEVGFDRTTNRPYKKDYEKYLMHRMTENTQFCVFGDGNVAKSFFCYLDKHKEIGSRYDKTVVSKKKTTDDKVVSLRDYALEKEKGLLLVAVSGIYIGEVVRMLKQYRIENYEILNAVFLNDIQREMAGE